MTSAGENAHETRPTIKCSTPHAVQSQPKEFKKNAWQPGSDMLAPSATVDCLPTTKECAPNAPDVADIVAMARQFVPWLEVDDVRAVQSMVSEDIGEIIRFVKRMGYEPLHFNDPQTPRALQLVWMSFCQAKGSVEAAEAAVCKKLKKVDPGMAVLLYGARGMATDIDPRTGLRRQKGKNAAACCQADIAAIIAATAPKSDKKTSTGIQGLLCALFGDLDKEAVLRACLDDMGSEQREALLSRVIAKAQNLSQGYPVNAGSDVQDLSHCSSRKTAGMPGPKAKDRSQGCLQKAAVYAPAQNKSNEQRVLEAVVRV